FPLFSPIFSSIYLFLFFFFNHTATTEIYTLSLHDALPICEPEPAARRAVRHLQSRLHAVRDAHRVGALHRAHGPGRDGAPAARRSEEHTSELQSRGHLVCRLLLEKKKKNNMCYNCGLRT